MKAAVDDTFNAITVDGECSTNDCVFALANGASAVDLCEAEFPLLVEALTSVCRPLATGIVRGGEGATKLVTVTVVGATSNHDARQAARAIANSLLVKTAIHGGDPNWGRLVAVAGRSGSDFVLERAAVRIGAGGTVQRRLSTRRTRAGSRRIPHGPRHRRRSRPRHGRRRPSEMWTCDLTAEYVRINARVSDVDQLRRK